jgi:predicted TIM-barrel fold metal-dependent hydrolase
MSPEATLPTLIDFHGHWLPPAVVETAPSEHMPPTVRAVWPLLTDLGAQLRAAEAAGIDLKVLSAPYSALVPAAHVPRDELPRRTNEAMAAAVAEAPGRLAALATVDAFRGDEAAEETRHAIGELGLSGLILDASQGELLLSAPEARPTLTAAAELGVPVFAHPVNPPILPERYAVAQGLGVLVARAAESTLSTLHLLASGVLDELPGLRLVLAGMGAAALSLAAFLDVDGDGQSPADARSRLFIDTMGFDPPTIRFAIDVVGAEQVLVGSDWPISDRNSDRKRVDRTLTAAGLDDRERDLVAAQNSTDLLIQHARSRGVAVDRGRR